MNFSMLEKIGGAALICAWLLFGANFLGNVLVKVDDHQPMAAAEATAPAKEESATKQAEKEPAIDFNTLLAAADPAAGEKVFKKCQSCHSIEKGGPNKVGPHLWDVVDQAKASVGGFSYSDALSGLGGEWTYDDLNAFLTSPKTYAPGTKMTFNGIGKAEDRAAVIAYLRAQSDSPKPLP